MIKDYFVSNILWMIADLNSRYNYLKDKSELRNIANNDFNEADIVNRLVTPMISLTTINSNTRDIIVKSLDLQLEVKFLRNFKSKTGYASKIMWKAINKDFIWLDTSIERNEKGKRAFIIGWFNVYSYLGEVIQLGMHSGKAPKIETERVAHFPFIKKGITFTSETTLDYKKAFQELPIEIYNDMQCVFYGKREDVFHIVLFF